MKWSKINRVTRDLSNYLQNINTDYLYNQINKNTIEVAKITTAHYSIMPDIHTIKLYFKILVVPQYDKNVYGNKCYHIFFFKINETIPYKFLNVVHPNKEVFTILN